MIARIGYAKVLQLTTVNHCQCIICFMEGKRIGSHPSMLVGPGVGSTAGFVGPAWRAKRDRTLATHLRDEHLGHPLVVRLLGKDWK